MNRTCFAALIVLCGLTASAPAQVYTSWYGPGYDYGYAPAYSYGTGYGPLSVFDWRWWSGRPPYGNTAYYSSWNASPTYATAYTAGYSPWGLSSTSYYAPPAYSAMYSPALASSDTCCIVPATPCCATSCCGTGLACAGGNCPGGNCSMNYSPNDAMTPRPDPGVSGSSGSRRFESESDPGTVDPNRAADPNTDDQFRRTDPNRPDDGYNDSTARDANYPPSEAIKQRNGEAELPKKPADQPDAETDQFHATPMDPIPDAGLEQDLNAPEIDPAADRSLLELDSKLTRANSMPIRRHALRARFGNPQLARAVVDPATLPAPVELRLVKK